MVVSTSTTDIVCPCHEFSNLTAIRAALDSSQEMDRYTVLQEWLSGAINTHKKQPVKHLSCGKSYCQNRVQASYAILNGIREACCPFLAQTTGTDIPIDNTPLSISTPRCNDNQSITTTTYEESFPSLKTSTKVIPPKPKRRIRPALVHPPKTTGNLINVLSDHSFPEMTRKLVPVSNMVKSSTTTSQKIPFIATTTTAATTTNTTTTPIKKVVERQWSDHCVVNLSISPNVPQSQSPIIAAAAAVVVVDPLTNNNKKEFDRLVDLYCNLIHHCLVPSSALEIHLLLRLLAVTDNTNTINKMDETHPFRTIFPNASSCRTFASCALRKLSLCLKGLGSILCKDLVEWPLFGHYLPDMMNEFTTLLHEHSVLYDASVTIPVDHTALLTLPFKEQRDSRHHYKTQQAMAVYQNQEESRDAFLYQLRAFLKAQRGTLTDTAHANQTIQRIQQSSRQIVHSLLDSNWSWFCEFFTDFLLQIGPIPIQETDQDLLGITDQDKLQKLHRRFSSKASYIHKDRSSKSLVVGSPATKNQTFPRPAAQQLLFPGHQEFFFSFIMSADSYTFSHHLRARLVGMILDRLEIVQLHDIGKNVMDLCLLARFLGVLVFSPNWHSAREIEISLVSSETSLDGLHMLNASGLSILNCIQESVTNQCIVAVVPWVVELLKLSEWDNRVRNSKVYWKVLSALRQIQLDLLSTEENWNTQSLQNKCYIGHCLELFFGETIGLIQTMKLPPFHFTVETAVTTKNESLDSSLVYNKSQILLSNSYLEDLSAFVAKLAKKESHFSRSPGATRKLRPSVVRPTISSLPYPSTIESPNTYKNTAEPRVVLLPIASIDTIQEGASIQAYLRASFFHQHGELKNICEFAASQTLKKFGSFQARQHILSLLADSTILDNEHLDSIRDRMLHSCTVLLKSQLKEKIIEAIALFHPFILDPVIVDIAAEITATHGEEIGKQLIEDMVDGEIKKAKKDRLRENKKRLFKESHVSSKQKNCTLPIEEFLDYTTSLILELDTILKTSSDYSDEILLSLRKLNEWLVTLKKGEDMASEQVLRLFFKAVLLLDEHTYKIMHWALSDISDKSVNLRWNLVSTVVHTTTLLTPLSQHGLKQVVAIFGHKSSFLELLCLGSRVGDPQCVSDVFGQLVAAKLIKVSLLKSNLSEAFNMFEGNDQLKALIDCLRQTIEKM